MEVEHPVAKLCDGPGGVRVDHAGPVGRASDGGAGWHQLVDDHWLASSSRKNLPSKCLTTARPLASATERMVSSTVGCLAPLSAEPVAPGDQADGAAAVGSPCSADMEILHTVCICSFSSEVGRSLGAACVCMHMFSVRSDAPGARESAPFHQSLGNHWCPRFVSFIRVGQSLVVMCMHMC